MVNYNSFFENNQPTSVRPQILPSIGNPNDAPHDSMVNVSLLSSTGSEHNQITHIQYATLLSHIESVKKQLTRLEVKMDRQNAAVIHDREIETIDMAKLQSFGLPIMSQVQLNVMEDKLKDEEFRNKIVSFTFYFNLYILHFRHKYIKINVNSFLIFQLYIEYSTFVV